MIAGLLHGIVKFLVLTYSTARIIRIFVFCSIMKTKVTLTIEKTVIEKADRYAEQTGRSLSELVENYLTVLTDDGKGAELLSTRLKNIAGVVKLPKSFDEEKVLNAYFESKQYIQA